MENAKLRCDKHHVKNYMTPLLGPEKEFGIDVYEKTSCEHVEKIIAKFGLKNASCLGEFCKNKTVQNVL